MKPITKGVVVVAMIAVAAYIFPIYIFQELLINWLAEGRGYYSAVLLCALFAGIIFLAALCVKYPGVLRFTSKPWVLAGLGSLVVITLMLFFGGF